MVLRDPAKKSKDKKPEAKQPEAKTSEPKKPEVSTAKDGSTTVLSKATDGTTTAVTTSADGCTVTTVVTRPDGSSETTTEIVTTTETEVDVTQLKQQTVSPTAAAAARAVADFESVSEDKDENITELAWHAWSASATAAAMGVKEETAEKLRALSDNSEWKKEDFKKVLPAFMTYMCDHHRHQEKDKEKSLAERALAVAGRRSKERKAAWELARAFTLYYPAFPIHRRGLRFSKTNAVLMDQVHVDNESSFELISVHRHLSKWLNKIIVISLLRDSSEDCARAKNVIVLHDGEVVRNGSWDEILKYVQDLGVQCPLRKEVTACLGEKNATAALFDQNERTLQLKEAATS
ncbi:ABC transporter [Phytophthora megakarya]|uniref:ABC transporter n=1 Tax=Phytophthora megakarya TaxID=4795 RepID=A0A225WS51_9STRA|nr:ABC transporter [Phytophthora megakarya]